MAPPSSALDERRQEVRALDDYGSIEWSAGSEGFIPKVHHRKRFFRGIILFKYERGWAYELKSINPMDIGTGYDYKFDVKDVKNPIITTVTEAGWRFTPALWPWQIKRSM